MLLKLALRNIIGNGWRSLINVFIITLVLTGLIWMEAMWFSWLRLAKTQQQEWEFAGGILRAKAYDPYDVFSWERAYAPIPLAAQGYIDKGGIVPVLISPSVIYPSGRMMNAMVKGIPHSQVLLKLPSAELKSTAGDPIPAIIGTAMAKSAKLEEGDIFTLRVKDSAGAFNAIDLQIAMIMDCPVPSLDIGTVWIDLAALQELKQIPGTATTLVLRDPSLSAVSSSDFREIPAKEFFADLDQMVKTKASGQSLLFLMLILLAMLAVFDTQALAIFKRRKEIGMLTALGMTKRQIIRLFTMEGALYMAGASVLTAILGFPLFYYFAAKGFSLPAGTEGFGVAGFNEPIKFSYPAPLIVSTLIVLFLLTVLVSWLPARKIARMSPTAALKGK